MDGFDEVSSLGLQGGWRQLSIARFKSLEGVRRLISDSANGCGIAIAGRDSFFDNERERVIALRSESFVDLQLNGFGEVQIAEFLKTTGYNGVIPPWLPGKPLLLTTLFAEWIRSVSNGNQADAIVFNGIDDPAKGWNKLLDVICDREARIEPELSGTTIRIILERLATKARATESGLGPITTDQITKTFEEICGYTPADQSLIVLQRLPGLGRAVDIEGQSRMFVDDELASACSAGDIVRYIQSPHDGVIAPVVGASKRALSPLAIAVTCERLAVSGLIPGAVQGALESLELRRVGGALAADLSLVSITLLIPPRKELVIHDIDFRDLDLTEIVGDFRKISYVNCCFGHVSLTASGVDADIPYFDNCLITLVSGRVSAEDLPVGKFNKSDIEIFEDSSATNDEIIRRSITPGEKVMLITLKKLFVQSVSGRKEDALYRGIPASLQQMVPRVLNILRQQNMVTEAKRSGGCIWCPVRRMLPRARKILAAPASNDPLVDGCRALI